MPTNEPEPRYRLLGVVEKEVEQKDRLDPHDEVFTWPHLLVRHVVVAAGHDRGRLPARHPVRRSR